MRLPLHGRPKFRIHRQSLALLLRHLLNRRPFLNRFPSGQVLLRRSPTARDVAVADLPQARVEAREVGGVEVHPTHAQELPPAWMTAASLYRTKLCTALSRWLTD